LWEGPINEPEERTPETTESQGSYQTVPELSEPVENLFSALLDQKGKSSLPEPEQKSIQTAIIETNKTMAGPDEKRSEGSTDKDKTETKTKEPSLKKMNMPKPFTGKREELKKFLQDVLLYLLVNKTHYETDADKIAFTLSFFEEGDAAAWKEQLLEEKLKAPPLNLGAWDDFEKSLKASFSPYDAPGDALDDMKNMRLGDKSIEEHVSKFKMAVTKSGLDADSSAVVDYFRQSLSIPLQKRIMTLENPPTTLEDWCKWAMKMDNNYKRMQRAIGRTKGQTDNTKKKEDGGRRWVFPRKDPNTMDVDAITTERRNEMMKKGLCFKCEKPGHISRDCPDDKPASGSKNKPPSYASTWPPRSNTPKKKMTGQELLAHVRALTAEMEEGEKEKFYDEAEKEGF
jgi:hypothetical protein